jgi:hypothetical protein
MNGEADQLSIQYLQVSGATDKMLLLLLLLPA